MTNNEILIGRDNSCHIRINPECRYCSGIHGALYMSGNTLIVTKAAMAPPSTTIWFASKRFPLNMETPLCWPDSIVLTGTLSAAISLKHSKCLHTQSSNRRIIPSTSKNTDLSTDLKRSAPPTSTSSIGEHSSSTLFGDYSMGAGGHFWWPYSVVGRVY